MNLSIIELTWCFVLFPSGQQKEENPLDIDQMAAGDYDADDATADDDSTPEERPPDGDDKSVSADGEGVEPEVGKLGLLC